MGRFKIGMRVRRISSSFAGMKVGDIGTISKINVIGIILKEFNRPNETGHSPVNLEPLKTWRERYGI